MGQICFGSCFLVGLDSHLLLCVVVDLSAKRSHDFQTLSRQPWLRTFWRLLFQEFVFCKRLIGCFLIHLACIFVTCWACLTDPLHVSRVSDIFDVFGLWCGQSAFNKSLNLAKGAAIWERGQILGEWDFQLLSIRACGTRISLSRYVSVCVCMPPYVFAFLASTSFVSSGFYSDESMPNAMCLSAAAQRSLWSRHPGCFGLNPFASNWTSLNKTKSPAQIFWSRHSEAQELGLHRIFLCSNHYGMPINKQRDNHLCTDIIAFHWATIK